MVRRHADIADALRQRIFSGLHLGLLQPGERLPSVRDLARELGADPRVVLRAYRDVEKDGLVDLRPRSGIYVSQRPHGANGMARRTADWLVDILVAGLERGMLAPEFRERVRERLETVRLRAACIECNADQIASLTGELRADYGVDAVGVELGVLDAAMVAQKGEVFAQLARADLLVTTPFHQHEVEAAAARLDKPVITVSLRPDLFGEIARRLPSERAYFVVADRRFAVKLPGLFAAASRADHLQALVAMEDDLGQIPEDAATYVTRLARERLGDVPLLRRVMPVARVFSPQTARELFSFIVRANLDAQAKQD